MLPNPKNPDQLWIGSRYGLYLMDIQREKSSFFPLETPGSYYNLVWLAPIHFFHNNILMGGPAHFGIDVFDMQTQQWKPRLTSPMAREAALPQVTAFADFSDSILIVGTYDHPTMGTVSIFPDGQLKYDLKKYDLPAGALSYTQKFIYAKDGSIWGVGNRGIIRITRPKSFFPFYRLTTPGGRRNNWQRSFLRLETPGKFLLGTYRGDGLIEVDWKNRTHRFIPLRIKRRSDSTSTSQCGRS